MKKISYLTKSLLVLLTVVTLVGCSSEKNEKAQEITKKLDEFTEITESEDSYVFEYSNGDYNKWSLIYSTENEFVRIEDDAILDLFMVVDGENTLNGNSELIYDFSDNEIRIYFNEDIAEIEILSYNLGTEEYTVNQDGEVYDISEEFKLILEENGFLEIVTEDINLFEDDLESNGLNLEDVAELTYNDLK